MDELVTVYVVSGLSLESLLRARQGNIALRPIEFAYEQLPDAQKPKPTELGRFFNRHDAEAFIARLHPSWFRPTIASREEPRSAQHPAHGGVGGT